MAADDISVYSDIIDLPHHVSDRHPRMSMHDRAAQFAPFAALTGHGAAIRETERLTDSRLMPDEDVRVELDRRLGALLCRDDRPEVEIEYFVPDERKQGGRYVKLRGRIKRVDAQMKVIAMVSGEIIRTEDVWNITEVCHED